MALMHQDTTEDYEVVDEKLKEIFGVSIPVVSYKLKQYSKKTSRFSNDCAFSFSYAMRRILTFLHYSVESRSAIPLQWREKLFRWFVTSLQNVELD